jgi:hypothetical protein
MKPKWSTKDGSDWRVCYPRYETIHTLEGRVFTKTIYPLARRCQIDGRAVNEITYRRALNAWKRQRPRVRRPVRS